MRREQSNLNKGVHNEGSVQLRCLQGKISKGDVMPSSFLKQEACTNQQRIVKPNSEGETLASECAEATKLRSDESMELTQMEAENRPLSKSLKSPESVHKTLVVWIPFLPPLSPFLLMLVFVLSVSVSCSSRSHAL